MSIARHAGILILLLAVAAAISWFLPINVSSVPFFLGAAVIFIAYLGISLRLAARNKGPKDE